MTDRPIIFSAPTVRALLDGRKSQTRRIIKPSPEFCGGGRSRDPQNWNDPDAWGWENYDEGGWNLLSEGYTGRPFYARRDRLWVREAFSYESLDVDRNGFMPPWYWADGNPESGDFTRPKPSIHMPRWASRLTLLVTDVRVQRLCEISVEDAVAEGIDVESDDRHKADFERAEHAKAVGGSVGCGPEVFPFKRLWNSIHGPDAWDQNPWVAALTFTVHRCNIDTMEEGTRRSPASPPSGTPSPPSAPSPVRENSDE